MNTMILLEQTGNQWNENGPLILCNIFNYFFNLFHWFLFRFKEFWVYLICESWSWANLELFSFCNQMCTPFSFLTLSCLHVTILVGLSCLAKMNQRKSRMLIEHFLSGKQKQQSFYFTLSMFHAIFRIYYIYIYN